MRWCCCLGALSLCCRFSCRHRPAGRCPDAARPAVRGVRRGAVPQAQPVDRPHHGARLPAAGARAGRGQGGIAGRQRGADAARQAHLPQRPALRDAFRLPARCPAPAALLLRPAGIGDTRRADAGDPRRSARARAADRRHADPAARPGALERARAGAPGLAGKRRPAARAGARRRRPPAAAAVRRRAAHPGGPHAGAGTHPRAARADDGQGGAADVRRAVRQPRGRAGGGHRRLGTAPGLGRDGRLPRALRPSRMDRHGQRSFLAARSDVARPGHRPAGRRHRRSACPMAAPRGRMARSSTRRPRDPSP